MRGKNDNYNQFRPISAVNKLSKIKKNIIPGLIPQTPITIGHKREHSVSPRSYNRIKSAHPLNLDRERLMEENISLKTQLNKIKNDFASSRKEINTLNNEIVQKDKLIESMMSESSIDTQTTKMTETHLVFNLKKQYKELRKENEKITKELEIAKKNIKNTKLNELVTENKILSDQVEKLKSLYQHSKEQTYSIEQNVHDYNIMKEALSKQDYIILNFQENYQKMNEEMKNLNGEIEKLNKTKKDKIDIINKLKQKLKYQYKINEKLVLQKENIKNNKEYLQMKNKYESKLQKMRKDLAYFKDSNAKNEKIIRDMKQFQTNTNNINQGLIQKTPPRIIYTSNPQPIQDPPPQQNAKILLLQSKFLEEKTEKEKLQKKVDELENKLKDAKKTETKVILTNSFSGHEVSKILKITDYEYFSDYILNEFTYILLKNMEANKIDMSIIESRVLNEDCLKLLKDQANYKSFISTLSNSLCDIIKIQQERDQIDVHSFIKTFLFNSYISKKCNNPDEFKTKFLALFDNINFYSIEQKQELNKIICSKLTPVKSELLRLLKYFDENNNGYVTFTTIKKILEELKIKFKNDSLEYFIYIMKNFHDEERYLKDLRYENLLKILEETQLSPNDNVEEEKDKAEDDDDAIEITNEEYLAKVQEIIERICTALQQKGKCIDDYFINSISKSINEYRAIHLSNLVDILKKEFAIELSHLEIFCLFTKIKPGNSLSNDDDNLEEIIDYDKFKREIENFLKNPPKKKTSNHIITKSGEDPKKKKIDNYDEFEHAEKENDEDNVKEILISFMKKYNMSFERFVFPVHCMMKLTSNGKKFNRYIDVEFFKHFLYQNTILINNNALMKFLMKEKMLYNNERVNLDYLKFILSGQKGIRDNKVNDFMIFKPMKPKDEGKDIKEGGYMDDEEKESLKLLQKEIYGDDEEFEVIKNKI